MKGADKPGKEILKKIITAFHFPSTMKRLYQVTSAKLRHLGQKLEFFIFLFVLGGLFSFLFSFMAVGN